MGTGYRVAAAKVHGNPASARIRTNLCSVIWSCKHTHVGVGNDLRSEKVDEIS